MHKPFILDKLVDALSIKLMGGRENRIYAVDGISFYPILVSKDRREAGVFYGHYLKWNQLNSKNLYN